MMELYYSDSKEIIEILEERNIDSNLMNNIVRILESKGTVERKVSKQKEKIIYYNDIATYDTETTTVHAGERWNTSEKDIGFVYLNQIYIAGYIIFVREIEDMIKFFNDLENRLRYKLIIYVHNLSFEWQFLKDLLDIDFESVFAIKKRMIVNFKTSRFLEFRCSYKLTNMSLEKFTEAYSTKYFKEKEIMDYDIYRTPFTTLDFYTCLYSALDVISLYDALNHFFQIFNISLADNIPTSTAIVRRDVREVMLNHENKRKTKIILKTTRLDIEQFKLIEKVKAGGNTHANREHIGKIIKNVGHCDYTSSYPFQMCCLEEYPMSKFTKVKLNDKNGILDIKYYKYLIQQKYMIVATFIVQNIRLRKDKYVAIPCLSISHCEGLTLSGKEKDYANDNGRLLYHKGVVKFSMYDKEFLECFLTQYDFDNIYVESAYICKKGYLPLSLRTEIAEYFKKKTQLKGIASEEYYYMKSKNNLNGIFGMAYTCPVRMEIIYDEEKGNVTEDKTLGYSVEEWESMTYERRQQIYDSFRQEKLDKFYSNRTSFLAYQWGSCTAMLGRVFLQKAIDIIDAHDVLYCDTDSVFFKNPENNWQKLDVLNKEILEIASNVTDVEVSAYNKKGKKSTLGEITKEDTADRFKTLGAKKYAQEIDGKFEITIAGVPKQKGSLAMEKIENFDIGYVFGSEVGKKTLTYNDCKPPFQRVKVGGGEIVIYSNIAFRDATYELNITDSFRNVVDYYQNDYYNFNLTE